MNDHEILLTEIEVKTTGATTRWLLPLGDPVGGRAVGGAAQPARPGPRAARPRASVF